MNNNITPLEMARAASNDPHGVYTLRNEITGEERAFLLKDFPYRDYLAFCSLAAPIFEALVSGLEPVLTPREPVTMPDGTPLPGGEVMEAVARIGIENLDFRKLLALAGDELPALAMLVAKQSDPAITENELLKLARRPHVLLDMVMAQMEANNIVKEFADFFPRLANRFGSITNKMSEKTTETTA